MKRRINNKKIIIAVLIVLLLALAIGYAAFSDILTISGTANAKGTFDLEFQNAEVVKNIGADETKTTAVISEDKNTLTVNVADLSYPGSGVEFSVDIVNVGSIPAEVQAVTPTNITGSEKIKVAGLDAIKTDHPKIEAGDKCNIHFTVEWPLEAGEILESENNISFGLQVEYAQSTGEVFEVNTSHTDTDKNGNIINTETYDTLISQITPQDYGKSINYIARVTNNETKEAEEVSNWKVLYNDKNNVYLILDDYLPVELVPEETGLEKTEKCVYSSVSREILLDGLKTENYWQEFANGVSGAISTGAPSGELIMKSYNEKYNTNFEYTNCTGMNKEDKLYLPHTQVVGEGANDARKQINGYWLTNPLEGDTNRPNYIWHVRYSSGISADPNNCLVYAARPVVKLPSTVTGTVGETIEIK